MMHFARLHEARADRPFWAAVTHLDHIGARARLEQATLLARWVRERSGPVVVMGDFNDAPGSPPHRALVQPGVGLMDTWEALGRAEDKESLTHHGFEGIPQKKRMDWILATSHFRVQDALIVRDHAEGFYPSDHYPYLADLALDFPE